MAGFPFDRTDASVLVGLAANTELDLTDLGLPSPWKVITTFTTNIGPQGFIAAGTLPSNPAVTVALLAVGMSWSDFIENSLLGEHVLSFPPGGLVNDDQAMADLGTTNFYEAMRKKMWDAVLFAKRTVPKFQSAMPMVVIGLGPGAPLAQMAGLDFRVGHSWSGQISPATDMTEYSFSCVPAGNQRYADSFKLDVPAGYTVNLKTTSGVTVDFYPTGAPSNYALAGEVHSGDAKIAVPDDPWVERDSPYYQQTLAATPPVTLSLRRAKVRPAQQARSAGYLRGRAEAAPAVAQLDSTYNPVLAYTMSLLAQCEYQRFQHPDLPLNVPPTYSLSGDLSGNGVQWASIYFNPDRVVVAFRGLVTWQETITTWGTNRTVQPTWLSAGGRILVAYDTIYGSLRSDLQQKLRALNMSGKPLILTGHDAGGALAAIAAYDLLLNPVSGAPAPAGVYVFGTAPVGDGTFLLGYNTTVGAMSFPVVRPDDVIPKLDLLSVQPLPQAVPLPGGVLNPLNGSVYHALTTYTQLLDPSGGFVAAQAEVTEEAKTFLSDAIEQFEIGRAEVHKCVLDTAATDGRMTFGWTVDGSYTQPWHDARGRAVHVLTDVVVSPGHELHVEAPAGEEVRLFAQRLTLTPGARVRVSANARLQVGHVRVLAAAPDARETGLARIDVVGAPGRNGLAGAPGADGANGGYEQPGAPGSHGGYGQAGTPGGDAPPAVFFFGTLEGVLVVHVEGGAGGNGGAGGKGGNGGNGGSMGAGKVAPGGNGGFGGSGGSGGNGGNGSTVTIDVRRFAPGAHVVAETPASRGGTGGTGGAGGTGGRGMPPGSAGAGGSAGTPGAAGRAGKVNVRQV